jgi:alkyldihydroxyacetonephosphate synthase
MDRDLIKIKEIFIRALGKRWVSDNNRDLTFYNRDLWPREVISSKFGVWQHKPDLVLWPGSIEEVVNIVRLVNQYHINLIPFGAGSGVCGATVPTSSITNVIIDLKRMNRIINVDYQSLILEVEAGAIGYPLEVQLNNKGFTLGHFPSSIYCSSVGGWLAARSAGQESSRYGKIEDMVVSLKVVTGAGEIIDTSDILSSEIGGDINQLFIGSEGTLGIICSAELKLNYLPKFKTYSSFIFKRVDDGLGAIRDIMQEGVGGTVMRLYDELDTYIALGHKKSQDKKAGLIQKYIDDLNGDLSDIFLKRVISFPQILNTLSQFIAQGCLLIVIHSGNENEYVKYCQKRCREIAERYGGEDSGEEPALRWEKNRYSISYKQSKIFYAGGFVDTMEIATTWDRIADLYYEIKKVIQDRAFLMAHFSHAYEDGCSIYFTFASRAKNYNEAIKNYDFIWKNALDTVVRMGATISHHHGVGLSKIEHLRKQLGKNFELYEILKRTFDPNNIMNRGKFGSRR